MKLKKKLILRPVVDENVLIPVGAAVTEFNGVFTISPTAALAFSCIEKGLEKQEILQALLDNFEIDAQTAEADLDAFLKQLESFGII